MLTLHGPTAACSTLVQSRPKKAKRSLSRQRRDSNPGPRFDLGDISARQGLGQGTSSKSLCFQADASVFKGFPCFVPVLLKSMACLCSMPRDLSDREPKSGGAIQYSRLETPSSSRRPVGRFPLDGNCSREGMHRRIYIDSSTAPILIHCRITMN